MTVVIVSYIALREKVDTAKREIAALVETVCALESDCAGISMLQGLEDPTRFTLIENWPSQAIFLGLHMQQPHIQSFIQAANGFLAGPPEISFWQPVNGV